MHRHLAPLLSVLIVSFLAFAAPLAAAEAAGDAPVDVPDDIGLGERLALVAWLREHHIEVADPNDLAAMRRSYRDATHVSPAKEPSAPAADPVREQVVLDLWRRHHLNASPTAATDELQALLKTRDEAQEAANRELLDEQRRLSRIRVAAPVDKPVTVAKPGPDGKLVPGAALVPGAKVPAGGAATPAAKGPGATAAPLTVESHFTWLADGSSSSFRTYRALRHRLVDAFLAQDHRQHPWAAAAGAHFDQWCVVLADPLGARTISGFPSFDQGSIMAAGCDDPLLSAYVHDKTVLPGPHPFQPFFTAMERLKTSPYGPEWTYLAADSWMYFYGCYVHDIKDLSELGHVRKIFHETARAVLLTTYDDPDLQEFVLRRLVAGTQDAGLTYYWDLYQSLQADVDQRVSDPWTKDTVAGMLALTRAQRCWTGISNPDPDNRDRYYHELDTARQHLDAAWARDQRRALPAWLHLVFGNQNPPEDGYLDSWFQRTLLVTPDHAKAREIMVKGTANWGETRHSALRIGRQALADGRFDSEIPWTYVLAYRREAHWQEDPRDDSFPLVWNQRAWDDLVKMYEGYLKSPQFAPLRTYFLTNYLQDAEAAGRGETVQRLLGLLRGNREYRLFEGSTSTPRVTEDATAAAGKDYAVAGYKHVFVVYRNAPERLWYGPFGTVALANAFADAGNDGHLPEAPDQGFP